MEGEILRAATEFYLKAREDVEKEYQYEIDHVERTLMRPLSELTVDTFFQQYVFVVLCSYWKEQYARKEWDRFFDTGNLDAISNTRKRAAVATGIGHAAEWLDGLKAAEDKIAFLDSLPMIGPVTRYHIARNLGIDCVKPDRHLVRLAAAFGYGQSGKVDDQINIVNRMCKDIQQDLGGGPFGERLGVIDVVLWRYCNIHGSGDI
jgi:hypothetical protein